MPEFSKLAICHEAIQRIYRNAVLDYARKAFQLASPGDWEDRVKRLYGNEWQHIEDEANVVDFNNFAEDRLVDVLDCLGVNHLYVLFESPQFFDALFPLSANETVKKKVKKSILEEQTRIQALRNSIAHPPAADLRYGPVHARLTDACEILRKIDKASPAAAQIDALMKMLHDGSKPPPPGPPPGPGPGKPPPSPKVPWSQEDAQVIKDLREAAGLTQKRVGELTGIGRGKYSWIENPKNVNIPTKSQLSRIIAAIPGAHQKFGEKLSQ